MRAARGATDLVVVTLFVNPTQFGPNEDLVGYPRDLDGDRGRGRGRRCRRAVHARRSTRCTRRPPRTTVHVDGLTDRLCGASRPDALRRRHDGRARSCSRSSARAPRTSAARTASSSRWSGGWPRDLDLPVEVVACPLVRGARRRRDVEPQRVPHRRRAARGDRAVARAAARCRRRACRRAATPFTAQRSCSRRSAASRSSPSSTPSCVDAATLEPVSDVDGEVLLAVAANVGRARLIDNCTVSVSDDGQVAVDLGVVADVSA